MKSKLINVVCLLIFMVMVLPIAATPVSAQSMDAAGSSHCAGQEKASVPLCCVNPNCPLSHSITANVVPASASINSSKVVQSIRLPANLPAGPSFTLNHHQRDTFRGLPAPTGANYCRNSLKSEEPPHI